MDLKIALILFFAGSTVVEFAVIFVQAKNMGDKVTIRKQVQKNRNSPNNAQQYNSNKKGLFKRLKLRKNGKH